MCQFGRHLGRDPGDRAVHEPDIGLASNALRHGRRRCEHGREPWAAENAHGIRFAAAQLPPSSLIDGRGVVGITMVVVGCPGAGAPRTTDAHAEATANTAASASNSVRPTP